MRPESYVYANMQTFRMSLVYFLGSNHARYEDTGIWDLFQLELEYARR